MRSAFLLEEKKLESYSFRDQPDGVLASRFLQGNERAFELLVLRYSSPLLHFISHMLGDYDRSSDVLQQVLIKFYRALPTLHRDGTFKPWLFQVAYHQVIDEVRGKRTISLSEFDLIDEENEGMQYSFIDPSPSPQEQLEYQDLCLRMQRAINDLPERFQIIARLRYTEQLTFREIGERLHIPEATAKTYFQRSKPLLRSALHTQHLSELLPSP